MKNNQFIEVFSKINDLSIRDQELTKEAKAESVTSVIWYGLDALSEFAFNCDCEKAHLLKVIREKFDPGEPIGDEVHKFIESIYTLIIQSNRYFSDYGKIARAVQEIENS
ncbi:MAG TPA: hypothetical protein P5084_01265 [Paludibacter sp.]|nr:hypothetical protein [Paludibacter sp.]